jgi:hypothetical protein
MNDQREATGTARALHEFHHIEKLKEDYDEHVQLKLTERAFQRVDPDFTEEMTKGVIKGIRLLMSGQFSIESERRMAESKADLAVAATLKGFSACNEL